MNKLLDEIGLRFVSGNSVPVERATLRREEYDQLCALLSAQEPTWRPIETAPRDETMFLGYRRGTIRNTYLVPRDDCVMWSFGGVTSAVEVHPDLAPTHWMPLPSPPSELAKQEAK